jgi:hypothetical protein
MVLNLQLVAALMEDPGGAEQHGGVRVVAAGVHLPGHLAPVLPLHFLLQKRNIYRGFSSRMPVQITWGVPLDMTLPVDMLICREMRR